MPKTPAEAEVIEAARAWAGQGSRSKWSTKESLALYDAVQGLLEEENGPGPRQVNAYFIEHEAKYEQDDEFNYTDTTYSLTEAGEEKYKDFVTLLYKQSTRSDSYGDDLRRKLAHWFSEGWRTRLERGMTDEEKAVLDRWFQLSSEERRLLVHTL